MVSPGLATSTQPGAGTQPDRFARPLTIGFCLVALVLGAWEAWTSRLDMNPDGIQYLDNAAAYRQGDFQNALNTQWSPLYPWLIAGASAIVRPSREQEFAVAHAVNFGIFALSLACFLFFLRSLRGAKSVGLLLLAYSAFLDCSLDFTHLRYVTPDLLVSCFVFLAAGLLVRMANGLTGFGLQAALGVSLGLGYLAKAPFLPIGVCCIVLAFLFARKRAVLALAVVLTIDGAYIAALSQSKHRFTFGDSARLNVAWHVDGLPNTNWQGGPAKNGQPVHPTRQLAAHPAIFEFDGPVAGTFPSWYDPAYWYDGLRTTYEPRRVVRTIVEQLRLYRYLVHHRQLPLVFAVIALPLICFNRSRSLVRLKTVWPALVLGAIPFAMYAPVHAEGRYLAPFFVLLWTTAFACLLDRSRAALAIATTAAILMCVESAAATLDAPRDQPPARVHFAIARALHSLGVKPGDRVAMVTGNLPYSWAYLSGTRIALEISFTGADERARESEWSRANQIIAVQRASVIVSPAIDGVTNQPGWIPIATLPEASPNVFAYPIRPDRAY